MLEQETAQSIWERSLIAVVRRELEQLQYLDSDISDDTGDSDVYAVVSRIGALTDLADEDGFGFSTKDKEALARLDEEAMMIMRARSARTHNVGINHENEEQFAARALYDAVVYNTPWLLSGDDSRHALTISKELFSTPSNRCGDWPGFDIVQRAVRVQDYRAMKLAGPLYEK